MADPGNPESTFARFIVNTFAKHLHVLMLQFILGFQINDKIIIFESKFNSRLCLFGHDKVIAYQDKIYHHV